MFYRIIVFFLKILSAPYYAVRHMRRQQFTDEDLEKILDVIKNQKDEE